MIDSRANDDGAVGNQTAGDSTIQQRIGFANATAGDYIKNRAKEAGLPRGRLRRSCRCFGPVILLTVGH